MKNIINQTINIAMVSDLNYFKHIKPLANSIRKYSDSKKVSIHIITDASKKDFDNFFNSTKNLEFIFVDVGEKISKMKSNLERISNIANARLFIPDLIEKKIILYVDIDMLVVSKGIDKLFEIDMTNFEIAGVLDGPSSFKNNMKRINGETRGNFLDLENWKKHYLNTGLILFNNSLLRETRGHELAIKYLEEINPDSEYADQDAIYYAFGKKTYKLPYKYNAGATRMSWFWGDPKNYILGTVVAHFSGRRKPWDSKKKKTFFPYYRKYQKFNK